jgi:hypothetical protein
LNAALAHQKYNLVILMAGTNDALREFDSQVNVFFQSLLVFCVVLVVLA